MIHRILDRIWPILFLVGARRGGGPEGWGPGGVGAQIFALFFSLPPEISFFLLSLGVCFLVEFWWCLKRQDAQRCAFGVLWLSCETPAAPPVAEKHLSCARRQHQGEPHPSAIRALSCTHCQVHINRQVCLIVSCIMFVLPNHNVQDLCQDARSHF